MLLLRLLVRPGLEQQPHDRLVAVLRRLDERRRRIVGPSPGPPAAPCPRRAISARTHLCERAQREREAHGVRASERDRARERGGGSGRGSGRPARVRRLLSSPLRSAFCHRERPRVPGGGLCFCGKGGGAPGYTRGAPSARGAAARPPSCRRGPRLYSAALRHPPVFSAATFSAASLSAAEPPSSATIDVWPFSRALSSAVLP